MLRVEREWMDWMPELGRLLTSIARRDSDLARQGRRTAASVALNMAEAAGCFAGNRRLRYETALGALRETMSVLQLAAAWRYIAPIDDERTRWLWSIANALTRLARRP